MISGDRRGRHRVLALVGAGLLMVMVACADTTTIGLPVPEDWVKTSEEGRIAGICGGAWQECGQITATYYVPEPARATAIADLEAVLANEGWRREGTGTFVRADGDANLQAHLEGNEVILTYAERF